MVFSQDLMAIQQADIIVALSYGRLNSAGIAWEAGYAYGLGKKIILVEMLDHKKDTQSLMVANGRYASVPGLKGLFGYDFKELPKTRTWTEQKIKGKD
jgi:nucleoside 2-deoxyribosyltransferase